MIDNNLSPVVDLTLTYLFFPDTQTSTNITLPCQNNICHLINDKGYRYLYPPPSVLIILFPQNIILHQKIYSGCA